ncbi:MAG: hypothetical protein FJX83_04645 [Bacteroidetes bacterium]|nr:hypothetical protein [Bacteroidota bacterium]
MFFSVLRSAILMGCVVVTMVAHAQEIYYSPVDLTSERQFDVDVIGKVDRNTLVYRGNRLGRQLSIFNDRMELIRKLELSFLPKELTKADFVNMGKTAFLFFQFVEETNLYVSMTELNGDGKLIREPVLLDSASIEGMSDFEPFQISANANKSKLLIYHLNKVDELTTRVDAQIFNRDMTFSDRARLLLGTPDGFDMITPLTLTHKGDLVFVRKTEKEDVDELARLDVLVKPIHVDTVRTSTIRFREFSVSTFKTAIDNRNDKLIIASIYGSGKRGNASGIFSIMVDLNYGGVFNGHQLPFSDSLRKEVDLKGSQDKKLFNDCFLDEVIPESGGGYTVIMEFRTVIGNTNALMRPLSLERYDGPASGMIYGSFLPGAYGFNGPRNPYLPTGIPVESGSRNLIRYTAGNMVLLSVEGSGNLREIQIVRKSQREEKTAHFISYALTKSGSGIHVLYNERKKGELFLSSVDFVPGDRLKRNPAFRGSVPNMSFMTRYARQISPNECIVPCVRGNYLSLAKVVF